MQISNFHHRKGGIWHSILLGTNHQKAKLKKVQGKPIPFSRTFTFIFIYHIGFINLEKMTNHPFYFSLFFLLLFLRIITTGEKLITNYPILITLKFIFVLNILYFSGHLRLRFNFYITFSKRNPSYFFLIYYVVGF